MEENQVQPSASVPPVAIPPVHDQSVVAPAPDVPPAQNESPKKKISIPKLTLKLPSNINFSGGGRKKILILAAVPVALVILLVLISIIKSLGGGAGIPLPISTPTPSPSAEPETSPSPYAKDDVVLQIEEEVNKFDEKLNGTVFRDDTIRVPSVDWNVSF